MPAVILWGATGQAKVVRPILECAGFNVTRVFDNARVPSPFPDVPMGGGRKEFLLWRETNSVCWFAVCISGPKRNPDRLTITRDCRASAGLGFRYCQHRSRFADPCDGGGLRARQHGQSLHLSIPTRRLITTVT